MRYLLICFITFFSSLIFANGCSTINEKKMISVIGQVANVGPDHSMEVVIRDGKKRYYLIFKDINLKDFFHKNNYKKFKISGYESDPKIWPPGIEVIKYELLN